MPRTRNQANQRPQVETIAPKVKTPAIAVTEIPTEDFGQDKNLKTLLKSV